MSRKRRPVLVEPPTVVDFEPITDPPFWQEFMERRRAASLVATLEPGELSGINEAAHAVRLARVHLALVVRGHDEWWGDLVRKYHITGPVTLNPETGEVTRRIDPPPPEAPSP